MSSTVRWGPALRRPYVYFPRVLCGLLLLYHPLVVVGHEEGGDLVDQPAHRSVEVHNRVVLAEVLPREGFLLAEVLPLQLSCSLSQKVKCTPFRGALKIVLLVSELDGKCVSGGNWPANVFLVQVHAQLKELKASVLLTQTCPSNSSFAPRESKRSCS